MNKTKLVVKGMKAVGMCYSTEDIEQWTEEELDTALMFIQDELDKTHGWEITSVDAISIWYENPKYPEMIIEHDRFTNEVAINFLGKKAEEFCSSLEEAFEKYC